MVYDHSVLRKAGVLAVFEPGTLTLTQTSATGGKVKLTVAESATGTFAYRVNPAARATYGEDFTAIATSAAFASGTTEITAKKGDTIEIIDLDSSKKCAKVGYLIVA